MKKTIKTMGTVLLASLLIMTGCSGAKAEDKISQIKKAGKIIMGTSPDYAPNEFYILDDAGNKKIVGSDIALGQAIADKLGVKLEIKPTDFSGVLSNIQAKEVDMGIAGFSYTEERAKVMQFSDGYMKESENGYQGILVKKENLGKYKSIEDVKNAKVKAGAQTGSIQYELAKTLTDENSIKQMGTLDAIALSLNQGDIDVMVISSDNSRQITSTFSDLVMIPVEEINLDPDDKYSTNSIGFPEGEEYASLIKVANEVIAESKANGNIQKWREKAIEQSNKAVE